MASGRRSSEVLAKELAVRHPPARRCGLVAAALILLFVTPPAASETEPKGKSSLADVLASLSLPDLDGTEVELGTLLGSGPVILDFWATWCKPCLMAMPELQELHVDLAARGLRVVGINEDGPRNAPKVRPFRTANGYTFPVLLDLNREAQQRLHANALPTTIVLDKNGVVLHSSFGYRPGEFEKLRALLEPHLAPKPNE
jgi:thiol-disulfide isomerase/thioredoxin